MNQGVVRGSRLFIQNIFKPQCKENCVIYLTKRWAGHSKWSNIKHIKMEKDSLKSLTTSRMTKKIALAVKEGGDNPALNLKLKNIIDEAKRNNVANTTITNAIKKAKGSSSEKPYWVLYKTIDEILVALEVNAPNTTNLISRINQVFKKLSLKYEKSTNQYFEERGIIIGESNNSDNDYEKAVEDAIEAGAEEVSEVESNTFLFQCQPTFVDNISKKLEEKGYTIHSATTEIDFHKYITVKEDMKTYINNGIEKVQLHNDDILRVVYNIKEQ